MIAAVWEVPRRAVDISPLCDASGVESEVAGIPGAFRVIDGIVAGIDDFLCEGSLRPRADCWSSIRSNTYKNGINALSQRMNAKSERMNAKWERVNAKSERMNA